MIALWLALQTVAGCLMSLAHAFRHESFQMEPGLLGFIAASLGIAVFMKVSSLRRRGWVRFLLGWWGGWVFFSITMYWVVIALKEFGNLPSSISILTMLLLSGYCALYFGLWSLVSGFRIVREKGILARILIWASLWSSLEFLREHLFSGFTWGEFGYHFAYWPVIAQSASVWGTHGLTFFWIALVSIVLHADEWWPHRPLRIRVGSLLGLLFVIVGLSHMQRLGSAPTELRRIALVQPNVDQGTKWDRQSASDHFRRLIELTQEAAAGSPDLIIWPETAYPFTVGFSQKQMPFNTGIPVLVGAVVHETGVNLNSALLVEGEQIKARFDKIHLVPFGEYVPFEKWLPFEKLVANVGRFRAGSKSQGPMELSGAGLKAGILICYEDIFSAHSVRHARGGAQLLVNMTNDAWYGRSSALAQHGAISILQAYQTGLPLVRATNTGLSLSYDFRELHQMETETEGFKIVELEIPVSPRQTFFVWSYPLMQWIWFVIFVIGILWKSNPQTKKIFFPD